MLLPKTNYIVPRSFKTFKTFRADSAFNIYLNIPEPSFNRMRHKQPEISSDQGQLYTSLTIKVALALAAAAANFRIWRQK